MLLGLLTLNPSMSDLRDELTDIQGVGEKTADKILDILDEHGETENGYLEKAIEAAQETDDRTAAIYLRRYAGEK